MSSQKSVAGDHSQLSSSTKPLVLVVDDDEDLLQLLTIRLQRAGFSVATANCAEIALSKLSQIHPRVVITDLKMKAMDGLELLGEIENRYPVLPVILLTAHGTIPDAVIATKKGAYAFLTKPINDEELINCLRNAIKISVSPTNAFTHNQSDNRWRREIITRSPLMEALLQQAELAASSDASIIIESDSGTGKELLARAIHKASARAEKPFVAVNCSAIPENLFESEMFGHAKGAFTGAHKNREGLFQQAHEGTLFLDELGDMPVSFQAKLLRTLQEGVVRPVGADEVSVDVRIIAATHRNLQEAIATQVFREDLFYRLSVVTLKLPALADRREDISLLADHFLKVFKAQGKISSPAKGFSAGATERLVAAPWPGNVRQLANVVQQCSVLCRQELIPESLVVHALNQKQQGLESFADARNRFEFQYLSNLLQATSGNVSQAARLAERNRSEFYKLLKKYNLEPADFR